MTERLLLVVTAEVVRIKRAMKLWKTAKIRIIGECYSNNMNRIISNSVFSS